MNKRLLLILVAFSWSLYADGRCIRECDVCQEELKDRVLLSELKGIVIVDEPSRVHPEGVKGVSGIRVEGLEIPGGIQCLLRSFSQFFHKEVDWQKVHELKEQIILYYQAQNHPFITVGIPEQELRNNTIQIVIMESRLGEVKSLGNLWFQDKVFTDAFRVKPKEILDVGIVKEDLAWLNLSPFHNTNAIFSPGKEEGTTDVELVTEDRFPARFYGGGDNTGNSATENARFFGGFNWGNVFGLNQTLSYQCTTSKDFNDFLSHTAHYTAPLPWRHLLYAYGGYATFHPDISGFHSGGQSAQLSMRYTIPFLVFKSTNFELTWGADYKFTNNNIAFEGATTLPIITQFVNLFQGVLGVFYGQKNGPVEWGYHLEFFFSPAVFLPHQSNSDYRSLRYKAENRYCYARGSLTESWAWIKKGRLNCQIRGQIASANLLPSEQFGLGGYDTVRGYDEREVNTDNALCMNLEFRLPSWSFSEYANDNCRGDQFTLLGFIDYGLGANHQSLPNEPGVYQLLGVGPGLRVAFSDYFSMRFDYGWRLLGIPSGQEKGSKGHFGAILSF